MIYGILYYLKHKTERESLFTFNFQVYSPKSQKKMGMITNVISYFFGIFTGIYLCRNYPQLAIQIEDARTRSMKVLSEEVRRCFFLKIPLS